MPVRDGANYAKLCLYVERTRNPPNNCPGGAFLGLIDAYCRGYRLYSLMAFL
jgi:hypothetical protein